MICDQLDVDILVGICAVFNFVLRTLVFCMQPLQLYTCRYFIDQPALWFDMKLLTCLNHASCCHMHCHAYILVISFQLV